MNKTDIISLKEYVDQIDLKSDESYEILYDAFTQKFAMPLISFPIMKESLVMRSRNNKNEKNFVNFNDLSYPDKSNLAKFSRANKPQQQVFYASDNFATNLAELLPYWSKDISVGESFAVTIGVWGFSKNIVVSVIPDFANERLMTLLKKSPVFKQGSIVTEYWDYINSFFRAQGFYEPSVYKFTSAYCNALLNNFEKSGNKVDGILYTSVQDPTGWNLAISPEFVDKYLFLKIVEKQFIQKQGFKNGKPVYDNFAGSILPKRLDPLFRKIIW